MLADEVHFVEASTIIFVGCTQGFSVFLDTLYSYG